VRRSGITFRAAYWSDFRAACTTAELIAYVQAGGNVFVSLGSALQNDTGVNEATAWNPFLNTLGLRILPLYHHLVGVIPILSADPLMNFVTCDVRNLNLRAGMSNSFDSKLDAALAALGDTREQNDGAAINAMYSFIKSVNAQRGTQLRDDQADSLVSSAERIIQALGG
jgi:hypothetical protein